MENYKTIRQLGQGSYGSVYLVKDAKDKNYALKRVKVSPFQIQTAKKQIQIMKKLNDANFVKIIDFKFTENQQQLQILMEYCQEGDLLNYFKRKGKTLSVQELLRIFKQIAQAFVLMNVKGIFHRDLKPQNILIGKGVIKVADFGCARSVVTTQISKIDNFSVQKGTPIWAAPELLKNEKYSFKCDVWSAGCMLYYLHLNKHPFVQSNFPSSILEVIQSRIKQNKLKQQINNIKQPTIQKILQLTLEFEDKERPSWREIWLSRIFSQKITNISSFIEYLKNITIIANWMTKQFWKIRKQFVISNSKQQMLVYFLIKFQSSSLKMALGIFKKDKNYDYLFEPSVCRQFLGDKVQYEQIKKMYNDHELYKQNVKKSLQTKQNIQFIIQKQINRCSPFADLDSCIRTAYKIILQIKDNLTNGVPKKQHKVLFYLAKFLNFQKNYSFESEPRVQRFICQNITNLKQQVMKQVNKYQLGVVE